MLAHRLARFVIVVLLLSLLVPVLAAQDAPEASIAVSDSLAAYMPADTLAYAALSISEDALVSYDSVISDVLAGIPGVPQVPSVVDLFDELLRSEFDTDFESMT